MSLRTSAIPYAGPAVVALVAGESASAGGGRVSLVLAAVGLSILARFRPAGARAWGAVLAAFLFGFGWGGGPGSGQPGWVPLGSFETFDLFGTVIASAERDGRGDRSILVRVRPSGESRRHARVRLRIPAARAGWDDAVPALRAGDGIRVWAAVGIRDGARGALAASGIDATGWVKSAALLRRTEAERGGVARLIDACRASLRFRLDRALGETGPARGLAGALFVGERSRLGTDEARALRDAGLSHLLAVSGLHVSMVLLAVTGIIDRISGCGRRLRFVVLAASAGAVAALTGAKPPVLRAAWSAAIGALGRSSGRDPDPLDVLALVAGGLALWRPALVAAPGFHLTVAATAGILVLAGPIASGLPGPRAARNALAVSLAACLATGPIVAWHFERLAPLAPLANLVAVPLCALFLVTGAAALAFDGIPLVGPAATVAANASAGLLLSLARAVAAVPIASFAVPRPSPAAVLAYASVVASALPRGWPLRRTRRLAAALAFMLFHAGPFPAGPGPTVVAVLDVGQAQAVVVRGPDGSCVLVDAGGTAGGRFDAGDRVVLPALARLRCRRLSALVVSHDDEDHAGGADSILRSIEVDEIWVGVGSSRDRRTRAVLDRARASGTATVLVRAGERRWRAGIPWSVLHPTPRDSRLHSNERTVVLRAGTPPNRILLPGDVEGRGEGNLLASAAPLRAEALVAPHHGAADAGGGAFLAAAAPRTVLVSVGRNNRFGHPAAAAIARIDSTGAEVYRTDRHGTITLEAGPRGWRVRGLTRSEAARE